MPKLTLSVVGLCFAVVGCSSSSGNSDGSGGTAGHGGVAQGGSASGGAGHGGGGAGHGGSTQGGSGGSTQGGSAQAGHAGQAGGAEPGGSGGEAMGGAGGSDPGDDPIVACLDATPMGSRTEAIRLEGNGVTVAFVRRVDPDGVGTSGTTVWLAQRLGFVRGDESVCVSDAGKLTNTLSHHNSNDIATATNGTTTWVLEQSGAEYWGGMHEITAKQGNQVLWGPVQLTVVNCTQLDTDADCTAKYQ